ncbi:hypothetical protein DDZ13_07330 [Coraliomargarita sinensis]|uniref:Uncharacterized protein n=1 Tax=Coraliomargarita sinensis TaxID=2174842 RepID=A0A317ZFQ1_9BACT|nr:hypothetical protein [Coraliomargarita sinensis]PXA04336.1 hypothetical protein DDZ13_07330 [Coraliomargarita sinensis]
MDRTQTNAYTAADIATALNRTARGVRKSLAGIEADSVVIVKGKETSAWKIESLPKALQGALHEAAEQHGHLSIDRLMQFPKEQWQPRHRDKIVTLGELKGHCIEDAKKLQRALSEILPMVAEGTLPSEEIEALGLRDYKQAFGHTITPGHWWKLAKRSLDRDRGFQQFDRTEIYLSAKLSLKQPGKPKKSLPDGALARLEMHLQGCETPARPSNTERTLIWDSACSELECLVEEGWKEAEARKVVINTIHRSGVVLSKNLPALRRNFDRKLKAWIESGGDLQAVKDKRAERSGNRRAPELPEEDRHKLIAASVERGCRISQAWRETLQAGELSYETTQRFLNNPASKSHVPHSIRQDISNDVRNLKNIHHGLHRHKMNGAYVTRDWSDCSAGDWFQGDDATMNHYYWEQTPEGIRAMRGQFLVFVDIRSDYVLGFCLHSERNYNGRIIRQTVIDIHDQYGLPRKGFYFERGIWKSARLLTGDRNGDETPWADTEQGLREFCQFKHATNPRSKVVERVIGDIQNRTDPLPGYAGRAEMTEGYERFKKKMLKAQAGKIEYSDFLMSRAQWIEQLEKACEAHNNEPQEGRLNGMSPAEAFESLFDFSDPLMRLDGSLRYLLANHRKPMRVTRNGIRLTFKGQSFYYRNEATGQLQGKEVLVWFDTSESVPESITITDMKRQSPVSVPLELQAPAMAEDGDETLSAALAQAEAHNKYARTLYRTIKPHFKQHDKMFRRTMAERSAYELGTQIEEDRSKVESERKRTVSATRKLRREESRLGIRRNSQPRNPERAAESLSALQKTRQKLKEKLNHE